VLVSVADFPRVASAADLAARFEWPGGQIAAAAVAGPIARLPSPSAGLQSLQFSLQPPAAPQAGPATLRVSHRLFPAAAAAAAAFSFFDPAAPQVATIQAAGSAPVAGAVLAVGVAAAPLVVVLTVSGVPAAAAAGGCRVLVGDADAAVAAAVSFDAAARTARVAFEPPPPPAAAGPRLGLALFGAAGAGCRAACCADGGGGCGGGGGGGCGGAAAAACFRLDYFDDAVPTVASLSPSAPSGWAPVAGAHPPDLRRSLIGPSRRPSVGGDTIRVVTAA
jgi:hypothetical protein